MKQIAALSITLILFSLFPNLTFPSDNTAWKTTFDLQPLVAENLQIPPTTFQNLTADHPIAPISPKDRFKEHFDCFLNHISEMNTGLAIINMHLQNLDILKRPLIKPYLERIETTDKEIATIYDSILNIDSLFYYENKNINVIDHIRHISKNIQPYINQISDYEEQTQVLGVALLDISILLSKWEEYQMRMKSFQNYIDLFYKNLFGPPSSLHKKHLKRKTDGHKRPAISLSLWSKLEKLKEEIQRPSIKKHIHKKTRLIRKVFNHKELNQSQDFLIKIPHQSQTSSIKILQTMPLIKYKTCVLNFYIKRFQTLPLTICSSLAEYPLYTHVKS